MLKLIFAIVQVLVVAYALWRGGGPERLTAGLLVLAGIATFALPYDRATTYTHVDWGLFSVDLALFLGLLIVALLADRFWPIWIAGLQLIGLACHAVRGYDATVVSTAYWLATTYLAYPMLFILTVGVARHRQRVAHGPPETSWTRHRMKYDELSTRNEAGKSERSG